MLDFLNFSLGLHSILCLIVLIIGYLIVKWIILPRMKVKFYENQGGYAEYSIFPRIFKQKFNDLIIHNDASFAEKMYTKLNPKVRFSVFNIWDLVFVRLVDPTLVKSFYNHQDYYEKFSLSSKLQQLMKNGLLFSEGAVWKRHRRVVSSIFHFEFVKSLIPTITNIAREFFDRLENGSLHDVDIMTHFQYITGDIIGRSFFGEELSLYQFEGQSLTNYMVKVFGDIYMSNKTSWRFLLGSLFEMLPKIKKIASNSKKLRDLCKYLIQERKKIRENNSKQRIQSNEITKKPDLLDLLLDTQNSNDKSQFTDDEIVDEFITFYLAGTDTTGHAIATLAYFLTQYPDIYKKIEEENKNVYRPNLNKEGYASLEVLNKLEYFQAAFKETLRHTTPVNELFLRKALNDHELEDLKIKKGTLISLNILLLNFNPKYFENPEKFDPDRWLSGKTKNLDPFAFIPFSSGPRNCIGQHLAQIESKVIMSEFISRYNFKLTDEKFKLKLVTRLLYEPFSPIRLSLQKKTNISS